MIAAKKTIYDIVQAKLLLKLEEAMQSGEQFTWVKPWKGAPYPCSYAYPSKPFSSPVNLLFLEAGEYLTYQQIVSHPDARIKKGAKQELVFQRFPVFQKDKNGKPKLDENGEPIIERFVLKYTREFHISAVEGIKSHFVPVEYEHTKTKNMEMADLLITAYSQAYEVKVEELYGTGQAYNQGSRVVLPDRRQYSNVYEYYSTAFHELGHSTRMALHREQLDYAQEELVAEITASLICATLGLENEEAFRNNLAYLQHWHAHIKDAKPKELYFAVEAAKSASEMILDSCPVVKQYLEPKFQEPERQEEKEQKEEKGAVLDGDARRSKAL